MYWAYYIMLSNHMWDDELSPARYPHLEKMYSPRNNTDFQVWDEIVAFLKERKYNMLLIDVGDAVRFASHPEIAAEDAVTPEFLKGKLDELRKMGITPIPKMNFSTCHHTWLKEYRHMVGTQRYLDVCGDLIRETCEIFGHPELFHLGMDEEDTISCFGINSMVVFRKEQLLWRDFNYFFDVCRSCGARPWVWSDYYWWHKDLFIKHMPKDVLQSNWFYYHFTEYPEGNHNNNAIRAFRELDELGYDQVPTCSTWNNNSNPEELVGHCRDAVSKDHLIGFLTASWELTNRDGEYALKNDAHRLYVARRRFYPETL